MLSAASHVEIRVSTNLSVLLIHFMEGRMISPVNLVDGSLSLLPARSKQKITLVLPVQLVSEAEKLSLTDVYFVARVWNHDNLSSGTSNVARVTFERPRGKPEHSSDNTMLIVGAPVALAVVVVVAVTTIIWRRNSRLPKGAGEPTQGTFD